uniref:Uncharacterized protein n=1 Tax=Fagus sylvatica TaxID=28930 RepID=A0A2N9GPL1_FAGSY
MFESARSASRASPISPGTSCEIDELSSPGNCARRSAMAWLLIAVGVSVVISYWDNCKSHWASLPERTGLCSRLLIGWDLVISWILWAKK